MNILCYNIIYIACGDKMRNRQAALLGKQSCTNISKITTGNTYYRSMGFIIPLFESKKIIELLRQPPGDINGIGRSKKYSLRQRCIGKSLFDHVLAIIKAAIDLQCMNVFPQGR